MGKPTTSTNEPLRIAPSRCRNRKHWTVEDWANLDFADEEDWQRAITIFEDRICYRFLDEVDAIQDMPFSGFAVMALDCLLIETLQQFREGETRTPWGEAEEYFRNFLTGTAFKEHFDEDIAEKFRDQIRNGILHQAETKGSSKIWIRRGTPLVRYTSDREGLEINRRLFHKRLVEVFETYVADLRSSSPDEDLGKNFVAKMNFICRVEE
jgi:hypothetical protein